jgi:hypothetical protein
MKALDHVMLWVARFLAFWMVFVCGSIILPGLIGYKSFDPILLKVYDCGVALLLVFAIWNLQSRVVRLCLGFGSAALVVTQILMPLILDQIRFASGNLIGILLSSVGLAATLWVSVRPPKNSKTSRPPSFNNHPLPQSC